MDHILILSRSEEAILKSMREIQFRETSADTERIKYNTNGIKMGSLKNINLLEVKRKHN